MFRIGDSYYKPSFAITGKGDNPSYVNSLLLIYFLYFFPEFVKSNVQKDSSQVSDSRILLC